MDSLTPTPKVATAAITGAAVTIIIWILNRFGIEVPGEVGAAMVTVLGYLSAYFAPRSKPTDEQIAKIPIDKLEEVHPAVKRYYSDGTECTDR